MDYVQFKRHVIRYRPVYTCLYTYVSSLMRNCIQCYAGYMKLCRIGVDEWLAIRQYGIFLWHYAELQNLTTGEITAPNDTDEYDWSWAENGLSIIRAYEESKLNDSEMMRLVAQWCREWYGWASSHRHFNDAMTDFRIHAKEKFAK